MGSCSVCRTGRGGPKPNQIKPPSVCRAEQQQWCENLESILHDRYCQLTICSIAITCVLGKRVFVVATFQIVSDSQHNIYVTGMSYGNERQGAFSIWGCLKIHGPTNTTAHPQVYILNPKGLYSFYQ